MEDTEESPKFPIMARVGQQSTVPVPSADEGATSVQFADPPLDASLAPDGELARECPNYVEMVKRALALQSGEGFADIEALDVFRVAKQRDNGGRIVFVFLPAHLPEGDEALLERATLYAIAQMHTHVVVQERQYTALWLCNNRDDTNSPLPLRWWRSTYYATPYVYHERLKTLAVVHPSVAVRCKLFALSYLHSAYLTRHPFWDKLDYADRLEFLDAHVPIALVKTLPREVKEYDKALDREMYATMDAAQSGSNLEQLSAGALSGMHRGPSFWGGGVARDPADDLRAEDDGQAFDGVDASSVRQRAEGELPKRNWED